MPNIKSAKKRAEISTKRKEMNSQFKGAMKTAIKKVNKTAEQADLKDAVKKIDKALKRGVIKKNTADRKKSRITKKVNEAK